jgi:hypothetical protein
VEWGGAICCLLLAIFESHKDWAISLQSSTLASYQGCSNIKTTGQDVAVFVFDIPIVL